MVLKQMYTRFTMHIFCTHFIRNDAIVFVLLPIPKSCFDSSAPKLWIRFFPSQIQRLIGKFNNS